jgi:hypothetical protein|nr:MAG TPA: hypothetical protein [Caudoviricetes sp.]
MLNSYYRNEKVRRVGVIYEDYIRIKQKYSEAQKEYEQALVEHSHKASEAKATMQDWEWLLSKKREQLIESCEVGDKIYYLRFVKRKKIREIITEVSYSEAQIYRIISKIKKAGK